MSTTVLYDLLSPEALADPYPLYDELRSEAPVSFYEPLNSWVLFRHADVRAAFADKRLSAARAPALIAAQVPQAVERMQPFVEVLQQTCVFSDPPYHTSARRVALGGFVPGAMRSFRGLVQEEIDSLLDSLEGRERVDLVGEFAHHFPSNVISRLMGVPEDMRAEFCAWTSAATRLFGSGRVTTEMALAGQQGNLSMLAYIEELAEQRRREPQQDLVSRLVATGDGAGMEPRRVAILCLELIGAAHNTTLDFVGNQLLTMLQHPEVFAELDDPARAVEELFRYAGPILFGNRVATEDLELGGQQIRKGEIVSMMLASANRDPEVFDDPHRFDPARKNARQHMAFGFGAHYCLGAPLARIEAELVLERFRARFPHMELEEQELRYKPTPQARGLEALWVRLR